MEMESQILQVNVDDIIPNRFQPRINFDEQGLKELAASIKEHGIIQPLVLRKLGKKYEIIAGERRYKASLLAGLQTVPAVISNLDDNKSAEIALVENIQRRDLSPIEEARSYKNILDKGNLTEEQLSQKMGLSRPTITNKLRLLNLDDKVQEALLNGKISERHARALLTLKSNEDQRIWLDKIINERLTVRQLDQALKKEKNMIPEIKNEEIEEVPIVDLNPNINEIKNNAMDINASKNNDVAAMMVPENMMTDYSESLPKQEQVPVETELPNQGNPQIFNPSPILESSVILPDIPDNGSKFFNTLENEPVNMATNDAFAQDAVFNVVPTDDNIEIFSSNPIEESAPVEPTFIPEKEEPKVSSMSSNYNNKFFQDFEEPVKQTKVEKEEPIINPMNFVETLDDNFEEKLAQAKGTDINTIIGDIRSLITNYQTKGVNISQEEADLPDKYQIIINIKK